MKHAPSLRTAVGRILSLAVLTAVGCGAGKSQPHGKVVVNGEPYKPAAGQTLQIGFIGEAAGAGTSAVAQVNPDGTFTVPGPTNNGLPPGKYRITVSTLAGGGPGGSAPPAGSAAPKGGDPFQGKYSDGATTPLTCEVTSANPEIVIDVGKGTVSTGG